MNKSYYRLIMIALIIMVLAAPVFGQSNDNEARKYLVRGMAAIEMAKSEAELAKAATEFKKATEIAPNMAAAWYNLGSVQVKIGQIKEAIASYKRYLAVSPQAEDARRISDEIIKLEYRLEQAESFKKLSGYWISESNGYFFKVEAEGTKLNLQGQHYSSGAIDHCVYGKCSDSPRLYNLVIRLDQRGARWTGFWDVPGVSFPTACSIPAEKAEVEATLDEARGRIVMKISRPKYKVVAEDEGPWSPNFLCAEVSVIGTHVEEIVLLGPMPAGGIGCQVAFNASGNLVLSAVTAGSPAEQAGLQKNDEITAIDGSVIKNAAEGVMKLRGQPGSTVQLVVKRTNSKNVETITLRRIDISTLK